MAKFGVILDFANVGADKYEAVMAAMDMKAGNNGNYPDGIITHTAGKTATGWCVVDVWESDAAFGKFRETRLGPALAKVGGMPEPKVTTFQVHNRFPG